MGLIVKTSSQCRALTKIRMYLDRIQHRICYIDKSLESLELAYITILLVDIMFKMVHNKNLM